MTRSIRHVENALKNYAEWRHTDAVEVPSRSIFATIRDSAGYGRSTGSVPADRMTEFVAAHERQLRIERVSRSVEDLLRNMPAELKQVFDAMLIGEKLEVPRSDREAAKRMGISATAFRSLKTGLLYWIVGTNQLALIERDQAAMSKPRRNGTASHQERRTTP